MDDQRFALLITNSEYDDPKIAQLMSPNTDGYELKSVLLDSNICRFNHVELLHNQSSSTIRREIARFYKGRNKDDLLLLYFSGHGIINSNRRLYLAVRDTEKDLVSANGISAGFINEQIENCLSKRQIVMLDCCHSGAFTIGNKAVDDKRINTGKAFDSNGSGYYLLTATDSLQYAWEGDKLTGSYAPSLFTGYIIEGLKTGNADIHKNGIVTIENLYQYVFGQIQNNREISRQQTPMRWVDKERGQLVIALNPHAEDLTLKSLYENYIDSIREENWDSAINLWDIINKKAPKYRDIDELKAQVYFELAKNWEKKAEDDLKIGDIESTRMNYHQWAQYSKDESKLIDFEKRLERLESIKSDVRRYLDLGNITKVQNIIQDWRDLAKLDSEIISIESRVENIRSLNERARNALRRGYLNEVENLLTDWKELSPHDPQIESLSNKLHQLKELSKSTTKALLEGDVLKAEKMSSAWQYIAPDDSEVHNVKKDLDRLRECKNRISSAFKSKDSSKAQNFISIWKEIAPYDPKLKEYQNKFNLELRSSLTPPQSRLDIANDFYLTGQIESAEKILEGTINIDPKDVDATKLLAKIYHETSRTRGAVNLLERTYRAHNLDVSEELISYSLILAENSNEEEKIKILNNILSIQEGHVKASEQLREIKDSQRLREVKKRVEEFEKFFKLENYTKVQSEFESLLKEFPNEEEIIVEYFSQSKNEHHKLLLGRMAKLHRTEQFREAKHLGQKFLEAFPDEDEKYVQQIQILEREENLAALYSQATHFLKQGPAIKAKKLFEQIDKIQPNYKDTSQNLSILSKGSRARRLSAINPADYFRLLFWIFLASDQLEMSELLYRRHSYTTHTIGNWLISFMIWLPTMIFSFFFIRLYFPIIGFLGIFFWLITGISMSIFVGEKIDPSVVGSKHEKIIVVFFISIVIGSLWLAFVNDEQSSAILAESMWITAKFFSAFSLINLLNWYVVSKAVRQLRIKRSFAYIIIIITSVFIPIAISGVLFIFQFILNGKFAFWYMSLILGLFIFFFTPVVILEHEDRLQSRQLNQYKSARRSKLIFSGLIWIIVIAVVITITLVGRIYIQLP